MARRKTRETILSDIKAMGFFAWHHEGESDVVQISAENGDNAADYYGEYRGGYPWVNPKIVEYAKKNGMMVEWMNPAAIALYWE